jgi:hypothetical protein
VSTNDADAQPRFAKRPWSSGIQPFEVHPPQMWPTEMRQIQTLEAGFNPARQ